MMDILNTMLKIIISIIVLCGCSDVEAETKIYHGHGEYTMSDYETPQVAEQRAAAYARKNIIEQAGVYVRTYTRTQNMQVTDDEVYIATNSVLMIINKDKKIKPLNSGEVHIEVNMTAEVDTSGLKDILKNDNGTYTGANYKELKNDILRIECESDAIKKDISARKKLNKSFEELKIEAKVREREFLANEKVEECFREYKKKDYNKILELGKEIIVLNPKNHLGYLNAGNGYSGLGMYDKAFEQYMHALALNKEDANVFLDRGITYFQGKNYHKAILDFSKAIKLNGEFVNAYYCRAASYAHLKEYKRALEDVEYALKFRPNDMQLEGFMAWLCGNTI